MANFAKLHVVCENPMELPLFKMSSVIRRVLKVFTLLEEPEGFTPVQRIRCTPDISVISNDIGFNATFYPTFDAQRSLSVFFNCGFDIQNSIPGASDGISFLLGTSYPAVEMLTEMAIQIKEEFGFDCYLQENSSIDDTFTLVE